MEHHTHHFVLSFYAHIVLMLYGVGMLVYSIPQQNKARGSYLVQKDGNMMLFRKPLPLRRAALAAVIFFALMLTNALAIAIQAQNSVSAYLVVLVALGPPALFLYLSGPDDIRLDGSQRTYERKQGFPWKPVTKFSTFDSIRGVSITPQNGVLLVLERPGAVSWGIILMGANAGGVMLSSTGTKSAAEALVEDLKWEYGFAVVPYAKK